MKVCLAASTIGYPHGGGHLWVYLNWALGLHALGCEVIWLESVRPDTPAANVREKTIALKTRLEEYGLADRVAICSSTSEPLQANVSDYCLDLDAAADADLLLNMRYGTHPDVIQCFKRSALLDIDPGLLQLWVSTRRLFLPQHDVYFTIGETVGHSNALFPDCGLNWQYTPPCVALQWWAPSRSSDEAPFTTVSHWHMGEYMRDGDEVYSNDKRTGFLPFLDLPQRTSRPLELALCFAPEEDEERKMLRQRGWRIREAWEVTSTPQDYRRYIQDSGGEFSCVKPSCVRLQNAWISDRTLCYLASGKPVVVQHTGPSRFLPDARGLFRFRTIEEAANALEEAGSDRARHSREARALAEEYFDAVKVVRRVLEYALP